MCIRGHTLHNCKRGFPSLSIPLEAYVNHVFLLLCDTAVFCAMLQMMQHHEWQSYVDYAFNRMDLDGDGFISLEELLSELPAAYLGDGDSGKWRGLLADAC